MSKNTRSPGADRWRPPVPVWNSSVTVGAAGLRADRRHTTKPLQSNPDGLSPHFCKARRGGPGRCKSRRESRQGSQVPRSAGWGAAGVAAGADGLGNGRGVAPSWRTPPPPAHSTTIRERMGCQQAYHKSLKPCKQSVISRTALDSPRVIRQNTFRFMEQTLLLNATYEPLKVVHWQKEMTFGARGRSRSFLCTTAKCGRSPSVSSCPGDPPARTSRSSATSTTSRFPARISTRATTTPASTVARCFQSELTFDHWCRSPGRPQGLGKHRVCCSLQPQEGRAHAAEGPHAPHTCPDVLKGAGDRITVGLNKCAGQLARLFYWNMELDDS